MHRPSVEQIDAKANHIKQWLDTRLQMPIAERLRPRLPSLEADVRGILTTHLHPTNKDSYRVLYPDAYVRLTHELVAETVGQLSAQAALEILLNPGGDEILDFAFENRKAKWWGEDGKQAPKTRQETPLCLVLDSARNARQGWGRIIMIGREAGKRFKNPVLIAQNPGLVRGLTNRSDQEEGFAFKELTIVTDGGALTHDSSVGDVVADRITLKDTAFRQPSASRITLDIPRYPYNDTDHHPITTETLGCPIDRIGAIDFYWRLGILVLSETEPNLFAQP